MDRAEDALRDDRTADALAHQADAMEALREGMREDIISTDENIRRLGHQLAQHYQDARFEACDTMGEIVHHSIMLLLERSAPATSPHTPV